LKSVENEYFSFDRTRFRRFGGAFSMDREVVADLALKTLKPPNEFSTNETKHRTGEGFRHKNMLVSILKRS
jgi:hypothetical protein